MPKPFHQLSLGQFVELLEKFPFTRQIESVHMHHTWRPNREQYEGVETINGMWRYHTQDNGWSDIAQHISIAPDGTIWTGRSWNQAPASATGFNGNSSKGPFMFETIGDFDKGKDPFDGAQKVTVLAVIAHVQKKFNLKPDSLRFHNAMSSKSCPGSALDYDTILGEVAAVRAQIDAEPAAADRAVNFPFADRARGVWQLVDLLKTPAATRGVDEGEGCVCDKQQEAEFEQMTVSPPDGSRAMRGNPLPPEMIRSLRPYVINLNLGRLSTTGEFQNSEADVDAIFEEHLSEWARGREGQKLPIVFYAHGGLTSEQGGLLTADEQVKWWLANGAYPIHFVWETGLMETLGQLINPNKQRGLLDFDAWGPTDGALELLARGLGGVKIWSGMKVSAEAASAEEGGARYAARKLKEFCDRPEFQERIELHAIGHSAGSIFHAHFLPAAQELGVPHFKSLHFLAPAIRVDTFEKRLLDRIGAGKGIDHLSVFTMARDFELADNCGGVYHKSLLYLIYYALEPDRKTPILGLEESIRSNSKLKRLFDLDKKGGGAGEVIWSVTKAVTGRSATTSRTHGGFNNDAPTMQSVAQRILGKEVTPFRGTEERGLGVIEGIAAKEPELDRWLRPKSVAPASVPAWAPAATLSSAPTSATGGAKRALCVGIDRYPDAPLAGCVNDAKLWCSTLANLGFEEPTLLFNEEANREAILSALTKMLRSSRSGDVIVFQYAGHGAQVPDVDGDEKGGDTPDTDEALCPIDYALGRFIVDDDLAAVFDQIPVGVSVTIFADCCHSGSNTRLAIGSPELNAAGPDVRKRFLVATPEMKAAHVAFRRSLNASRGARKRGAYDQAREVLFAACRSREVALESNGHGHFTTYATPLLKAGVGTMTNAEFQARLVQAFGADSGQNPELHCAKALRSRPLLAPTGTSEGTRSATSAYVGDEYQWRREVAEHLERAARALRG